tara:strand:+ start:7442 stop:7894 length:453 start_codon:yes stop_codon:yes gene_type:complete
MLKEIYDIKLSDLIEYPVWYFPMGDCIEDQVKPALTQEDVDSYKTLVRTTFETNDKIKHGGYIYWMKSEEICYLQPFLFFENLALCFYLPFPPDEEDLSYFKNLFPKESWPIKFESEEHFGLKSIKGSLEGLYYLGEDNKVCCQKVWEDS